MQSLLPERIPGTEIPEFQPRSPAAAVPPTNVRSCRYGKNCMRPDCKFWHEGRSMPSKEGETGEEQTLIFKIFSL